MLRESATCSHQQVGLTQLVNQYLAQVVWGWVTGLQVV